MNESRHVNFPVFLVAGAEAVYQAGIHSGWAKDDDSSLPRLYLRGFPDHIIHRLTKGGESTVPRIDNITVQDIVDIFTGGHLAASAEALGFMEAVCLDSDVMYDIISKAAGSNAQFVENVPKMKKPTWSLKDVDTAKDVGCRLVSTALSVEFALILTGVTFLSSDTVLTSIAAGKCAEKGELDWCAHAYSSRFSAIVPSAYRILLDLPFNRLTSVSEYLPRMVFTKGFYITDQPLTLSRLVMSSIHSGMVYLFTMPESLTPTTVSMPLSVPRSRLSGSPLSSSTYPLSSS